MTSFTYMCLILILCPSLSVAGFRLPMGVYELDEIEEALSEANEKKEALAFVLSEQKGTCPLCDNSTLDAFKRLKKHSTLVFLELRQKGWDKEVSPVVLSAFSNKSMGNIIPKVVITSPDMTEVWGTITYADMQESRTYRDMEKQVKALLANPNAEKPAQPSSIFWTLNDNSNQGYRGAFEKLEGDTLYLKLSNGNVSPFPLSDFVPGAVLYAKAKAGASDPSVSTPVSAASSSQTAFVPWTGSNGKVIQAAFVSLKDDTVQLRSPVGAIYTFPLSRLSPESQARAKEMAGE